MAPEETHKKYWLTDPLSKQRVHQWRSQEEAIMIGVQTALNDNPKLDTRLWKGKNPLALVIDPQQKLSHTESDFNLQKGKFLTIKNQNQEEITDHLPLKAQEILDQLYDNDLQSVIIEGGSKTLQCFIDEGLWDEARIFVTKDELGAGLKGPLINRDRVHTTSTINADTLITLYKDSMISSKA
jgi:diaminohydroxyphosphoribosylaminopyrimidine deaminase/5-amino-6-(5-phosphoribosylamino)uracil reductase